MPEFADAKEQFAALGVDVELALQTLAGVSVSLHCWQGDDVGGFEGGGTLGGGLAVTGNYPGKARNPGELRQDLAKALSLIPGQHRLNLHAMYGEFETRTDRDSIEPAHYQNWIDWCDELGLGFDFNPTCFSHPLAEKATLTHADPAVRQFWIEHCRRCREVGSHAALQLETDCVVNVWIPDGMKDSPADRRAPRERLCESLDEVFDQPLDGVLDSVEPKLFGIGSESFVAGSHDFYLAYAVSRGKLLCLDSGHYHPTESVADKLTSCLTFLDEVLLHVSRGVRWDSDHVVVLNDDLQSIARELATNGYFDRVHIGLDYFDASINRVAAWVIGTRALLKALLIALLEPTESLRARERDGDFTARLALQEQSKSLNWGAVWQEFCRREDKPGENDWLAAVQSYEQDVLARR